MMKVKTIENIIDSVDPYFILKDLGFTISSTTANDIIALKRIKEGSAESDAESLILKDTGLDDIPVSTGSMETYYSKINGNLLRILPYGYLNVDSLFRLSNNQEDLSPEAMEKMFIAGTSIDMLAYYMKGNYTKAFSIFFKYYGVQLKSKLLHEPSYIESAIKNILIKRRNILNLIIAYLFKVLPENECIECRKWMQRSNITSLKGFGFCIDSIHLFYLLKFIMDNNMLAYTPELISIDKADRKVTEGSSFATFINSYLFKESDEWIVIPYFSDYHLINSLKFINPKNNQVYQVYLNNFRLSFSGVYALSPRLDFNQDKVRIIENLYECMVLHNYAKNSIELETFNYLAVDVNNNEPNNLKSNLSSLRKPIFLNDTNSSLHTIKSLYDSLLLKDTSDADLYICNYHNYKEDEYVYSYNAFLEDKFKTLITKAAKTSSTGMTLDLQYLLDVFDVNQLKFKNKLFNWMRAEGFNETFTKLATLSRDCIDFKSFVLIETSDGYVAEYKDDPSNTTILSNYVLKVDQNIIFKDSDEIIHKGRLLMSGGREYPIAFSKKDLLKKNAVEDLALKAYTKFSVADMIEDNDENINLPTLFNGSDSPFYKNIITAIRYNINKAPCKYGILKPGWDKGNGVFTAFAWQANTLKFNIRSQNIYSLLVNNSEECLNKDLKLCFTSTTPNCSNYQKYSKFLNSGVRDILGYILSMLYRQYLGYNVKPLYVYDSVNARNLIKFIFLAFGQIAPYNVPDNERFIKSKKLFIGLNDYPVYVRCKNPQLLSSVYKEYPFVAFVTPEQFDKDVEIYNVNYGLTETGYKQVTKFTFDTISRFFKWLFNINVEEFSLQSQIAKDYDQMIDEGKLIFSYLWWDQVVVACNTECNPSSALRDLLMSMTSDDVVRYLYYYPNYGGCYVLRRAMLPEPLASKANTVASLLKKANMSLRPEKRNKNLITYYVYISKEMMEDVIQDVITKDGQHIEPEKLKIYVDKGVILDLTPFRTPARTISREKAMEAGLIG